MYKSLAHIVSIQPNSCLRAAIDNVAGSTRIQFGRPVMSPTTREFIRQAMPSVEPAAVRGWKWRELVDLAGPK
jgi:hypothetical protein